MKKFLFLVLLIIFAGAKIQAGTRLQQFHSDPKKFLNTIPERENDERRFSHREIIEKKYVAAKNFVRSKIMAESDPSSTRGNDRVETLYPGESLLQSLEEMEDLKEGVVSVMPWSDDYWPLYQGVLGKRYADDYFAYKDSWLDHFNYVEDTPSMAIFSRGDHKEIDLLSPSEKYDLLFGRGVNLTKQMWNEGKQYWERYNDVETWMGICHGWAPASFMLERPENQVVVKAFDGKVDLTFYPSDIKALSSLLWANVRVPTYFLGGRCNVKSPKTDEDGRIIDQGCFDTNPATWHRTVVEQIGRRGLSFVFDATFDYQVWNQPAISYHYTYFNPQTLKEDVSLNDGIIPIEKYSKDVFTAYRDEKTRYVVGVDMEVTYLAETDPTQNPSDNPEMDQHRRVSYMYDLELDQNFKIIGGEWYQNYHPDFIWLPKSGSKAVSIGDYSIGQSEVWSAGAGVPKSWVRPANNAAKKGQPLAKIVDELIRKSRQ